MSRNPGGNKRQERKDAVSGQEDAKQREDARGGNLGHIDNRDVNRRAIDDVSRLNTKACTGAGTPTPTMIFIFSVVVLRKASVSKFLRHVLNNPSEPVLAHMVSVMKRVREFFRHVLNNPLEHGCANRQHVIVLQV